MTAGFPRVALVTGASSGIGRLTADRLTEEGFRTFGTSRHPQVPADGRTPMLRMDVRSNDSVAECIREVVEEAGRIDVLVSNAGITHVSFAEETSEEDLREVFETNVFGVIRVVRSVLPLMREQASGGRIIAVGSLAGLVGVPAQAYYAASKHALEGYLESLRHEVAGLGVDISVVEPAFQRTALHRVARSASGRIAAYDAIRPRVAAAIERSFERGGDPADVADTIARIAVARRPGFRYPVGAAARLVPRLKHALPEAWFEPGLRRRFGLV